MTGRAPHRAQLSFDTHDRAWNELLVSHGGHYKQSGAWAEVKARYGWSVARVTVSCGQELLGGAQVLLRRLPVGGTIGLAPKAPVLAEADDAVRDTVLDGLHGLARRCRARMLIVHPQVQDEALVAALHDRGYRPSPLSVSASATSVIDLRRDEDEILARMRKKTRQHIRKGLRAGVAVHEGDEAQLELVHALHLATAQRKGFSPYPDGYFPQVWSAFRPLGAARLFFAEHEGEALSVLLVIAFGETVYTVAAGWSGKSANLMSNEVLYWHAIAWAKANGYTFWDFTSIDSRGDFTSIAAKAAVAIVPGQPLPDELRRSTTFFKLGFGGDVVVLPGSYDIVFNPVLRVAFRSVAPGLYRSTRLRKGLNRLRWRWPSLAPRRRYAAGG